ncbi:MAG: copper chaperone PCu(A)C [Sphingomonadales bacterium]|nr:MAG: copper chaperone PCu(A)C [Sphingomonadales bacterium]
MWFRLAQESGHPRFAPIPQGDHHVPSILNAALAVFVAASLPGVAGCAPEAQAPAPETEPAAAAGLSVSNARVVLPPVSGNPAAVYFDLTFAGQPGVTLEAVTVEGAGMTMIHDYVESAGTMEMTMADPVELAEGTPVSFAPGGLHVMAMEPSDVLKVGGTAKVTLTLSDDTTVTVDAPVRAAGDER